jgi:hypothetical protein
MKFALLLVLALELCGCALTPSVNTRKPGQQWNYYGDLSNLYRDETRGSPVALVWLDQVQFQRVSPNEFQKTVHTLLTQGYRKIGFVSVRSKYFVDPYSIKKLAADKGARMIVGCWFRAYDRRGTNAVNYWYQLLDKDTLPPPVPPPRTPVPAPAPELPGSY